MQNLSDFGTCKAMQDLASMSADGWQADGDYSASAAVCFACCVLIMQLCEQELLDQQLPYFPAAEGGTSTAAGDMARLVATSRQHWRALRRQHKRVWGESQALRCRKQGICAGAIATNPSGSKSFS